MSDNRYENFTDLGNARRLVRLHGEDLRYVHNYKRWLFWNDVRWREDMSGEVIRRSKSIPMDLYREAAKIEDADLRGNFSKHARRTESERSLKALISLAQSEEGIPASPDDFDADPWLLNTPNGIVHLSTGKLAPHSREAMCTRLTGVGYECGAKSKLWDTCLATWLPEPEVRAFVKRAVGYSLIGNILEQVLLILWGGGANGKTVFVEVLRAAIGEYALHTPAETLISNKTGGIPNDVARLKGARFVSASESEENRRLAEAKVKALTGGDTITARFMRAEFFEFKPTFTTWLSTNHKPMIRGQDHGIWRRIRLIPFNVQIPETSRDPKLLEKLKADLPAILAWAIEGALEYNKEGLAAPAAVLNATDEYRREQDSFGDFLEERCIVEEERFALASSLHQAFTEWAKVAQEESMSAKAFGTKLAERGFDKGRMGGHRGWHGIALANRDA
jgi:putative DNA primase/helicase